MTRRARYSSLLVGFCLTACDEKPSYTAGSASAWVPQAPTREHPLPSAPLSASAIAPAPKLGSLTLDARSLGWDPGTKLEIGAAFAHLKEEWPNPRGGLPRLVIDSIELYSVGATGMSCSTPGVAAAGSLPTAIVLQGKHKTDLEWEKDFAIGDDFELCVVSALPPGSAKPVLTCPSFELSRPNVVLSLSRDRAKGFVNAKGSVGSVNGHFNAEVCPLPPLE